MKVKPPKKAANYDHAAIAGRRFVKPTARPTFGFSFHVRQTLTITWTSFRAKHQGWLDAEWKVSELGRRAKYYRLTPSGRRQLTVEAREWERISNAIERVMKLA